jgi:hypothetical protein
VRARLRGRSVRGRLAAGGRTVTALVAAFVATAVLGGCAASGPLPSSPAVAPADSPRPSMTVSPAVGQTRGLLVRALGEHNLVLSDSQAPIRPAEAPLLAAAPRAVYQVLLPKDPTKGFIVVYEFPDDGRAAAAAAEEQAYLATGPGRVQRPQGTVTVIRGVGTTVVFYDWLPGAAQDPAAPGIQAALETLGVGYPVAS